MVRIFVLILMLCLAGGNAFAAGEIEATTSDGRKVILKPDGAWKFSEPAPVARAGGGEFTKPSNATKVLKSKKAFYEVWYDPAKWTISSQSNPESEFELRHSTGDAFAMSIAERISMPIGSLKQVAINNAKNVAPDLRVVSEGERTVNGAKVLVMRMEGTLSGIHFTYYGYYWAGKAGAVQLVTYTGQNLFNEFQKDFEDILNGLVIVKP